MGITDFLSGSSEMRSLSDVLIDELKDLYSAENQLVKALPKMEKKASSPKLKKAFRTHLQETKQQVKRLEDISSELGKKLSGKTCKAMKGLIEEGNEVISEDSENPALIDALLIGAAQRVEHYEIAAYGTARAMAQQLGNRRVTQLLDATIKEEGNADKILTTISVDEVLPGAVRNGKNGGRNGTQSRASKSEAGSRKKK